jgi:hypothetical protein
MTSPKKCFLPNEPKVVQCLPGNLKNSKPIKAIPKPKKANLNPIQANFACPP